MCVCVCVCTTHPDFGLPVQDPFHMDHFKVGRTRVRPTLHLSHAPANRVETGLDNRVRPTSEVGFDPVVSELEVS